MSTQTSADDAKPRSKLSRVVDVGLYVGMASLLGALLLRGGSGPEEGSVAAPFELPLASGGSTFGLKPGKPVLMEVFASWCGACERAAPMMADVHQEASEKGVTLIGVSLDDDASAARRAQRAWPIAYPVAMDDGSVSRGYGVSLLPTFVLIDEHGKVRRVSSGVPSRRTLSRWLSEL